MSRPHASEPAPMPTLPRHTSLHGDGVTVDTTTELRWFVDGPLPPEVAEWFTGAGSPGLVEHRVDTYQVDGRDDTGVKRRFGRTLELKRRQPGRRIVRLGAELAGWLETWRRWSPADTRVDLDENNAWLDVDKVIVKRRFDEAGAEQHLSEANRAPTGIGCDAEVAAVSLGGRRGWTLAFAAYGPPATRYRSIRACWAALAPGRPHVIDSLRPDDSCGYPAWLVRAGVDSSSAVATS